MIVVCFSMSSVMKWGVAPVLHVSSTHSSPVHYASVPYNSDAGAMRRRVVSITPH